MRGAPASAPRSCRPPSSGRPTSGYFGSSAGWVDGSTSLVFQGTEAPYRKPRYGQGRPFVVRAGDRISIERVERRLIGSDLDHVADRECRAAFLLISGPRGRLYRPGHPLKYWQPLSLARPHRLGRPTFDRIAGRVCDAIGVT